MSTSEIAIFGVLISLSVLSFLLNGTFLIVVCKSWTLVKRRRITYHVINLVIADSIFGASVFGYCVSIIAAHGRDTKENSTFITIGWTAVLTSLLAVCLMAIERAVCIKKPHTWSQILPLKRMLIVMAGNWLLTLALVILMHFYTLIMRFVLIVLIWIAVFITAVVYINMYLTIWKTNPNEADDKTQESPSEEIKERRNKLMQQKLGSFVLILTLVLLITVSPSFLTFTILIACKLFELNCKFYETVLTVVHYLMLLQMVNFIVNPIIYVWRIGMYRKAFWKMFGRADSENS